jgi:hypothetical protein
MVLDDLSGGFAVYSRNQLPMTEDALPQASNQNFNVGVDSSTSVGAWGRQHGSRETAVLAAVEIAKYMSPSWARPAECM